MYFARFAPHRGPGAKSVRREALARTSARDLQGKARSPYLAKTSLGQCKGGQTAAHRGCDNAKPRINRIGPRGPSQSGRGARPQSGHSPPPKIAPGPPGLGIKPAESACQGLYTSSVARDTGTPRATVRPSPGRYQSLSEAGSRRAGRHPTAITQAAPAPQSRSSEARPW